MKKMKKNLFLIVCFLSLLLPFIVKSQTFSVQQDTVTWTIGSLGSPTDLITNNTTSPITLKWQVVYCNFPLDWLSGTAFGICDNNTCYYNAPDDMGHSMPLYNDTTGSGLVFTTNPYNPGPNGPFNLSLNLSTASVGTHMLRIKIAQPLGTTDTVTFIINKVPAAVPNVTSGANDVLLYPNPANNELNVVFDGNADVKNIAVYNIIGKVLTVYKVTGSSANLNIENIPSGIYFVRLYNSQGNVVVTRKFTKQ